MALQDRQREAARSMVGDVPRLTTVESLDPTADPGSAAQLNGRRSSSTHGRFGVNMPAIANVLERYGLDPADEIARLLTERRPVLKPNGEPILDEHGKPLTIPALPPADHARLAAELLQYTRPKLKAIEVTQKPPELTDDQVEKRLQALLLAGKERQA